MAAFTFTAAKTFARIELLKTQVRIVLRRTTSVEKSTLDKIEEGVQKKYITTVSICGFDQRKLCRAMLTLEIDWDQHNLQLSRGKTRVSIDGWTNETAIEIDEMIPLFNKFVNENRLSTDWQCTISANHDFDAVCRALGFKRAEPVQWSDVPDGWSAQIPELPELRAGIRFVG